MRAIIYPFVKFQYPNYKPQIISNYPISNGQSVIHLVIGILALFDDWCLGFGYSPLTLSLFVFGVFTDHTDDPFSFYNFTLVTDFFNRCPDFHRFSLNSSINTGTRMHCPESDMAQGLFLPKNNSPPREIVGGEFHCHLIPGEDFDEVHSHLS